MSSLRELMRQLHAEADAEKVRKAEELRIESQRRAADEAEQEVKIEQMRRLADRGLEDLHAEEVLHEVKRGYLKGKGRLDFERWGRFRPAYDEIEHPYDDWTHNKAYLIAKSSISLTWRNGLIIGNKREINVDCFAESKDLWTMTNIEIRWRMSGSDGDNDRGYGGGLVNSGGEFELRRAVAECLVSFGYR